MHSPILIDTKFEIDIKHFLDEVQRSNPKADLSKLKDAISFAIEAHNGQKRESGEPYFNHCLEVAKNALHYFYDFTTIVAAILHDVIEDTYVTKNVLEKRFGQDIAYIVDGVTKISLMQLSDSLQEDFAPLRKIVVTSAKDPRVLFVKLADRLHNMRTLNYLPLQKQERIAKNTREVYAELAYYLGFGEIHRELENLSLKYLEPKAYDTVEQLSKIFKVDREHIKRQIYSVIYEEEKRLNHRNLNYIDGNIKIKEVKSREKSYYSIYQKMRYFEFDINNLGDKLRLLSLENKAMIKYNLRLTSRMKNIDDVKVIYEEIKKETKIDLWKIVTLINDFTGFKIIVSSLNDVASPKSQENICYEILRIIRQKWPVEIVFRDYITPLNPNVYISLHGRPKAQKYKSIHTTIIGPEGAPIELQIHTQEVENETERGEALHLVYKEYTEKYKGYLKKIEWVKQLQYECKMRLERLVEWQRDIKDTKEFGEMMKYDILSEQTFVFTPKGEVKELPAGSTPVDFAYAVHSEVGNRCVSAKVNGKIVPLRTLLKTGDIVEIILGKIVKPSRDWLHFVRTSRARNKIQHYLKTVDSEQYIADGKESLTRELKAMHLNPTEILKSDKLVEIGLSMGYSNISDLLINVAIGKVSPRQIITKLIPQPEPPPEKPVVLKPGMSEEAVQSRDGIKVKGIQDVLIRFAKCCMPVPGDNVIGFITRGRGVSIHKKDCISIIPFLSDSKRIVNVDWDMDKLKKHLVPIKVEMSDRPGTLASVLAEIANLNINVYSSVVKKIKNNRGTGIITLEIMQLEQLNEILDRLRQIPNVLSVARTKRMK